MPFVSVALSVRSLLTCQCPSSSISNSDSVFDRSPSSKECNRSNPFLSFLSFSAFLASSEYLSFRFSSLIVFLQVAARRAASLQANHSVLMAKDGVVGPLDHSVMITPRDGPSAAASSAALTFCLCLHLARVVSAYRLLSAGTSWSRCQKPAENSVRTLTGVAAAWFVSGAAALVSRLR